MALNLERLLPEKYFKSTFVILSTLLTELDVIFTNWIAAIAGLGDNINPELVRNDYMQYLADLLGTTLSGQDSATELQRRDELRRTVDWIKMKGTYGSINVIEYMLNTNFSLLEMYTNDYATFELVPWFVAKTPGENPPGLDSTYYKSPHFGCVIELNVKFAASGIWTYDYLYSWEWFTDLGAHVERTRPINTVPHYYASIEPECDDDATVKTQPGDIHSMIISSWPDTKLYFDNSNDFDDGNNWDQGDTSFYTDITKWKIGTGSKGLQPDEPGWTDLETVVSNGVVPAPVITAEKVVWTFIIPKQSQLGISELGLYSEGPDTIRFATLFPDINLAGNVDVRVTITVNRVS